MKLKMLRISFLCLAVFVEGCVGPPEGIAPIEGFEVDRYLGKWYEIARLDHRFERGMTNVSAIYTKREDDGIAVVNRGFVEKTGEWKSVAGKALFVEDPRKGSLKVSFFGPFYGGYHVLALDQQSYQYAMVCGPNRSYLWILARQRTLPAPTLSRLTEKARELGFAVDELIYVTHDRRDG